MTYPPYTSLALQQLFPIQILLTFLTFELPRNLIHANATDLKLSSSTYIFFPALSISSIHKVPTIKSKGGLVT